MVLDTPESLSPPSSIADELANIVKFWKVAQLEAEIARQRAIISNQADTIARLQKAEPDPRVQQLKTKLTEAERKEDELRNGMIVERGVRRRWK